MYVNVDRNVMLNVLVHVGLHRKYGITAKPNQTDRTGRFRSVVYMV